jgi:hypothetical protein
MMPICVCGHGHCAHLVLSEDSGRSVAGCDRCDCSQYESSVKLPHVLFKNELVEVKPYDVPPSSKIFETKYHGCGPEDFGGEDYPSDPRDPNYVPSSLLFPPKSKESDDEDK